MVPGVIGYIPEYRGLPDPPPGSYWASWALVEKREGRPGGGAHPLALMRIGQGEGAGPPSSSLSSSPPPRILFQLGFPRGKEGEGWPTTSPSPIRTQGGGGARPALAAPLSLH